MIRRRHLNSWNGFTHHNWIPILFSVALWESLEMVPKLTLPVIIFCCVSGCLAENETMAVQEFAKEVDQMKSRVTHGETFWHWVLLVVDHDHIDFIDNTTKHSGSTCHMIFSAIWRTTFKNVQEHRRQNNHGPQWSALSADAMHSGSLHYRYAKWVWFAGKLHN